MDDPVLRGRLIAIGIGVVFAGVLAWVMASRSASVADTGSAEHTKIMEKGCEQGGLERGSPQFAKCVEIATARCGGGGGVAQNLATCARAVAASDL